MTLEHLEAGMASGRYMDWIAFRGTRAGVMNTKQEIEAWQADCKLAEKGIDVNCPPPGWSAYDKDGNEVLHVLAPRYGMGTYKFRFSE